MRREHWPLYRPGRILTLLRPEGRRSVAEFPSHPGLNYHTGELLLHTGDAASASACFERALQADSRLGLARVGLADSYAKLGRTENAIEELKLVLNTDKDGTLHARLARWYQQSGHPREAETAFATAKQLKDAADQASRAKLAAYTNANN